MSRYFTEEQKKEHDYFRSLADEIILSLDGKNINDKNKLRILSKAYTSMYRKLKTGEKNE